MALFVVFNFISIVVNNKLKKNPFSRFQPIWLITSLGTSLISWVLLAVLIFLRMPNAVITGSVVASAIYGAFFGVIMIVGWMLYRKMMHMHKSRGTMLSTTNDRLLQRKRNARRLFLRSVLISTFFLLQAASMIVSAVVGEVWSHVLYLGAGLLVQVSILYMFAPGISHIASTSSMSGTKSNRTRGADVSRVSSRRHNPPRKENCRRTREIELISKLGSPVQSNTPKGRRSPWHDESSTSALSFSGNYPVFSPGNESSIRGRQHWGGLSHTPSMLAPVCELKATQKPIAIHTSSTQDTVQIHKVMVATKKTSSIGSLYSQTFRRVLDLGGSRNALHPESLSPSSSQHINEMTDDNDDCFNNSIKCKGINSPLQNYRLKGLVSPPLHSRQWTANLNDSKIKTSRSLRVPKKVRSRDDGAERIVV